MITIANDWHRSVLITIANDWHRSVLITVANYRYRSVLIIVFIFKQIRPQPPGPLNGLFHLPFIDLLLIT